jgi:hypothetical protein
MFDWVEGHQDKRHGTAVFGDISTKFATLWQRFIGTESIWQKNLD